MKKIVSSPLTLPLVWIFFFVLTHWPSEKLPEAPFIPHIDKVIHASLYAVLSFLLSERLAKNGSAKKHAWIVFFVLAAYGIFDELTQPYFSRTTETLDWLADICGVLAGITFQRDRQKKRAGYEPAQ